MVPKAELHCHIEGAVSPALALAQAERHGADLSEIVVDGAYRWTDFTAFLNVYDTVAALFRTRDDYARLAHDYLSSLAADGCLYSEIFISTDHAEQTGLSPHAYIDGLAEAIERAKAETGIEGRMIATGLRHGGPEAVERAARFAADNPHPLITGFGMAGDERMHHPKDFAPAFDIARDAGLRITVHAGELAGAESVRDALDHLRPERIGHGVRAIEDPALVERLAEERIVLEICPASNIALGVFADYASHPFNRLRDAGVKVTLNSDDPPHFHSSLANEYRIASDHFGLDDAALKGITRTAIEAAFCDDDTRTKLLGKLGQAII
ncbi:adenosine deaminase [Oceaniradius stylonematis]|uniref:Adenine deaminase n=1 Tax=Oceaniradius stylonematis TaxID=2184161 RepID=A0A3A8AFN6_9HYPH|nr:adenosine deaminase [Oceaniradius stylonematis]RKF07889.1 adenosine deaminase [Oceaniradius stylonematis]